MPTYRKRGRRWQAMIRIAGHEPESRTFPTRAEAKGWAELREEELRHGASPRSAPRTLADAMGRYAEDVAPKHRGERWEVLRLSKLRRDTTLAGKQLRELTGADIAAWRDRRLKQVSPASVRREWGLLRSVFEYARTDLHWIKDNPMAEVKRPKSPKARKRRISDDEIDRLRFALGWPTDDTPVETSSQQVAVMLLLAIETAMRAGEMAGLTWERVDLRQRFVQLPDTKNEDARDVPLSRRAVELLKVMLPPKTQRGSGPVFTVKPGSRDALFRSARSRAGIEDLHFHDSRAEAIIRLSKKLDVLELARMVGHRDLKSLMVYYRPTAAQIAKQLD